MLNIIGENLEKNVIQANVQMIFPTTDQRLSTQYSSV